MKKSQASHARHVYCIEHHSALVTTKLAHPPIQRHFTYLNSKSRQPSLNQPARLVNLIPSNRQALPIRPSISAKLEISTGRSITVQTVLEAAPRALARGVPEGKGGVLGFFHYSSFDAFLLSISRCRIAVCCDLRSFVFVCCPCY